MPPAVNDLLLAVSDVDDSFWDADDLAIRYKVARNTVLAWARRGILPPADALTPKMRRWRKTTIRSHEDARAAQAAAKAAARMRRARQGTKPYSSAMSAG